MSYATLFWDAIIMMRIPKVCIRYWFKNVKNSVFKVLSWYFARCTLSIISVAEFENVEISFENWFPSVVPKTASKKESKINGLPSCIEIYITGRFSFLNFFAYSLKAVDFPIPLSPTMIVKSADSKNLLNCKNSNESFK